MKICFLAGASSVHTIRWVNAMAERGHQVELITMHQNYVHHLDERVKVHVLSVPPPFGYYLNKWQAKKIVHHLQPDLLHVHYASGYGTLSRKIAYSPTLLSVWGSDVYLFPYENKRNEKILRKNLQQANRLSATGSALQKQTARFAASEQVIDIVAFGIDLELFRPVSERKATESIYIGTVKRLKEIYGIDFLLKAVAQLLDMLDEKDQLELADRIKILLVGGGPEQQNLENLADELGIRKRIEFVDEVANATVPAYLNKLDIYCALSRSESFGVAVLEASACEVPVVVSNVGGLPEVVEEGQTGYITDTSDIPDIAWKLYTLVIDPGKRRMMGKNGREFVRQMYDWETNVTEMEQLYQKVIDS